MPQLLQILGIFSTCRSRHGNEFIFDVADTGPSCFYINDINVQIFGVISNGVLESINQVDTIDFTTSIIDGDTTSDSALNIILSLENWIIPTSNFRGLLRLAR